MIKNILFISNNTDLPWTGILREALSPIGQIEIISPSILSEPFIFQNYQLIIIDAADVPDVPGLITKLRGDLPKKPIVVVTSSPTWMLARQVFLAGGTDYIRKTLDVDQLLITFQDILQMVYDQE